MYSNGKEPKAVMVLLGKVQGDSLVDVVVYDWRRLEESYQGTRIKEDHIFHNSGSKGYVLRTPLAADTVAGNIGGKHKAERFNTIGDLCAAMHLPAAEAKALYNNLRTNRHMYLE